MELTTKNYFSLKELGLKRAEIADRFGIPDWKLKKLIAANNWGKPIPKIEFEDVFLTLDEFSCYWAGFLASDGNVDSKNRVRIMLNYDDTGHLEKFKEYIGSTHSISSNTDKYYRSSFEITSKLMCEHLKLNFNIVPNKTAILKFPHNLTGENLKAYVRGYFDGDGSICESFSNKNSTTSSLYATFAGGCKSFITDLYSILNRLLALGGTLQEYSDTKFQIKYNTNDAKTLLTWMYAESNIHLDRKYAKYVDLVVNNNRKVR